MFENLCLRYSNHMWLKTYNKLIEFMKSKKIDESQYFFFQARYEVWLHGKVGQIGPSLRKWAKVYGDLARMETFYNTVWSAQ